MKLSDSKIFIVDDDEEIVNQVRRILENMGASVMWATDVVSAIDLIQKNKPHLIISDLNMRPFSGMILMERLKGIPELRGVPVIVLSALNDKNSIFKSISLGARDYIIKPIKSSLLLKKVKKALKDTSFLSYEFLADETGEFKVSVPATLQFVSEIGLRVELNTCLDASNDLALTDNKGDAGIFSKIKFISHNKAFLSHKGQYESELISVSDSADYADLRKVLTDDE